MVKQIGEQYLTPTRSYGAYKPKQSYAAYSIAEPISLGITKQKYHETRASIMNRLDKGKSKKISKASLLKSNKLLGGNMIGNRILIDAQALKQPRKVLPFKGGDKSPFLNFSSGRSTKNSNVRRVSDPMKGKAIVNTLTQFNRY